MNLDIETKFQNKISSDLYLAFHLTSRYIAASFQPVIRGVSTTVCVSMISLAKQVFIP